MEEDFQKIRGKIIKELKKRDLGINEPVTLVDGFTHQPIYDELSGWLFTGWPTIPMIILVGNNTGRVYYFALNALLP